MGMNGIVAAQGMALAMPKIIQETDVIVEKRAITDVPAELERLAKAVSYCRSNLERLMDGLGGAVEDDERHVRLEQRVYDTHSEHRPPGSRNEKRPGFNRPDDGGFSALREFGLIV